KELANTDGIHVIRGGVARAGSNEASIAAARKQVEQANAAETAKDIRRAIEHWRSAIASYEKNAAALDDITPYFKAHHRLARALMWIGQDDEARATMSLAARLAPNFALPSQTYSRLYRRWFFEAAQSVVRERPGALQIRSALPGAAVKLDGRTMDVAPVLIDRVLPGKHIITARVDGVPPFGAVVMVEADGKTAFALDFAGVVGGAAVGDVADAIAQNELSKAAVAQAVKAGKNADAAFVVVSGLAKDRVGNDLNAHTFVVNVATGGIQRLSPLDFDSELLTAESDVIRVVRQVENAIKNFEPSAQGATTIEKRTSGLASSTLNRVSGAPPRPSQQRAQSQSRGPRKVFRALEGGTIRIKDEEE
ncbi:MAG: hypothetical protein AAFV29_23155, partial [Myxococcota bacterium]